MKGDCTFVVARYKPPGNWFEKENENVCEGSYDPSFCENPKWVPSTEGKMFKRVKVKNWEVVPRE